MSVTDLNITDWNYESSVAETGIMLVESIQNFKTYFSLIRFLTEFNINVNFTRLYCQEPICNVTSYETYRSNLILERMNMSIS